MSVTTIRHATAADARAVAEVHVRAWREGYRGVIADEELEGLSVDARAESWRTALDPGDASVLVAEAAGGVAGFVAHLLPARDDDASPTTGEIAALYVDPPHWRRGVASALLREALDRLAAAGGGEATAWVLEGNAGGQAFWRAVGFARDGATAPHGPHGRVLRFRRPLTR